MKLDWTGLLTKKTKQEIATRSEFVVKTAWNVYDELGISEEYRTVVTVPLKALLVNGKYLAGAMLYEPPFQATIAIFCDELGISLEDTIRHELRHQWQYFHFGDACLLDRILPYRYRVLEFDARQYAACKKPVFGPRDWKDRIITSVGTAG